MTLADTKHTVHFFSLWLHVEEFVARCGTKMGMKAPGTFCLIAVLQNRAEPLNIVINLCELTVLGETIAILQATFQRRVSCERRERESLYYRRRLV